MTGIPRKIRRKATAKKTAGANRRNPKPVQRLPSPDTNRIPLQRGIIRFRNDPLQTALLARPMEFHAEWTSLILGQMTEATYDALAIQLRIRIPKGGKTPYKTYLREQGQ